MFTVLSVWTNTASTGCRAQGPAKPASACKTQQNQHEENSSEAFHPIPNERISACACPSRSRPLSHASENSSKFRRSGHVPP